MNLEELAQDCANKGTNLHSRITEILSRRFVRYEKVANVLALGLQSKQNVILWGPAGHAKSEMVEDVLKGLGLWKMDPTSKLPSADTNTYVQSFGEGMTEDQLWGGIDLRAMEEDKEIRYHPENSFLKKEVAVFEEMFDAPAICLLPLKHTLTQKFLAKGGAYYPMNTKCIIVCTNKSPEDLQHMGPSHQALVERFPLQLKVEWDGYTADHYLGMMQKHPMVGMYTKDVLRALAANISKVTMGGSFISPRSAMWAMNLVAENARANRRTSVQIEDFFALEFLPGMEGAISNLKADIDRERAVIQSQTAVNEAQKKWQALEASYAEGANGGITSPIKWLTMAHHYSTFANNTAQIACADSLVSIRDQMIKDATTRVSHCQSLALKHTKIPVS